MEEKTLDLTRYEGICGDPLVYVAEEFESTPGLRRLRVVYSDCDSLREASVYLERMGFKTRVSEISGGCVLSVEKTVS